VPAASGPTSPNASLRHASQYATRGSPKTGTGRAGGRPRTPEKRRSLLVKINPDGSAEDAGLSLSGGAEQAARRQSGTATANNSNSSPKSSEDTPTYSAYLEDSSNDLGRLTRDSGASPRPVASVSYTRSESVSPVSADAGGERLGAYRPLSRAA
jgi:hypothetical protein